jgi:mRNA-degrading endonuclease toxin of MazEF toxin-antitoxin module
MRTPASIICMSPALLRSEPMYKEHLTYTFVPFCVKGSTQKCYDCNVRVYMLAPTYVNSRCGTSCTNTTPWAKRGSTIGWILEYFIYSSINYEK